MLGHSESIVGPWENDLVSAAAEKVGFVPFVIVYQDGAGLRDNVLLGSEDDFLELATDLTDIADITSVPDVCEQGKMYFLKFANRILAYFRFTPSRAAT